MKKCFVCAHDRISSGLTNKMFENQGHMIIVKDIPCLICENCGEIYMETEIMKKLEGLFDRTLGELEVINFRQVA